MSVEYISEWLMHDLCPLDVSHLKVLSTNAHVQVLRWEKFAPALQTIEALDFVIPWARTGIDLSSLPNLLLVRMSVTSEAGWQTALDALSTIAAPTSIRRLVIYRSFIGRVWCEQLDSQLACLPACTAPTVELEMDTISGALTVGDLNDCFPHMASRNLLRIVDRVDNWFEDATVNGLTLSQISAPDQKCLRAVCKPLRYAIEPLIFGPASIVVDFYEPRLEVTLSFLETLGRGNTGWARCSRTFDIRNLVPDDDAFMTLDSYFAEWKLEVNDQEQMIRIVANFLNTLDGLDDVDLTQDDPAYTDISLYTSLDRLSGLRRFGFVSRPVTSHRAIFSWMARIVAKSPRLEYLSLPSARGWPDIIEILERENIRLTGIAFSHAIPELFAYLSSYSGLQHFAITSPATDPLADVFFDSVLPRHKDCLLTLSCPAYYEGEWCLGPRNLQVVSQLQNLQRIHMCVTADDIHTV
ncbi:hypothetical protein B0H17DRAFT_1197595 [Mycena rosella]|uniref:F-box domain-containing protein n=1 Tax=Mycena rosella TaxID=1033263 RepID=A0AAD7GP78_MYCRO|nr:hypothetical protein B0H17DRAFT_1197595 [Mycena rosella]